jgi:hypothetical protein
VSVRSDLPVQTVVMAPPMTLANMRANGVRAVIATCKACGNKGDVNVDTLSETIAVPETGDASGAASAAAS